MEVVEGVTLVDPQWSCGTLWDLSVLALALRTIIFFNVNLGPLPKKWTKSDEFSVFDRG